jgi:hypothetical protein
MYLVKEEISYLFAVLNVHWKFFLKSDDGSSQAENSGLQNFYRKVVCYCVLDNLY